MSIFNIFGRSKSNPESQWTVSIKNENIFLTEPNGNKSECAFEDIDKVLIVTTDDGPIYPDVFWTIVSKEKTLFIPQGAIGENKLADKIMDLPGFDNEKFIESMRSVEDMEFVCWTKD